LGHDVHCNLLQPILERDNVQQILLYKILKKNPHRGLGVLDIAQYIICVLPYIATAVKSKKVVLSIVHRTATGKVAYRNAPFPIAVPFI